MRACISDAVIRMRQVAPHTIRIIGDGGVLVGDIRRLTRDTEYPLGTQWVRAVDRFLASVFHLYRRIGLGFRFHRFERVRIGKGRAAILGGIPKGLFVEERFVFE